MRLEMLRQRHVNASAFPKIATMTLTMCLVVGGACFPVRAQDTGKPASQAPFQPLLVRDVLPVYPPIALSARVQGRVIVEVTIGPDGRVIATRVVQSVPLVEQAALDAVRQWQFAAPPAGVRSPVTTVAVNFAIGPGPRPLTATPMSLPPDVPKDFTLSFESRCSVGMFKIDATSDLLFTTENPTPVRLGLTAEDVAALYRALVAIDFFASRDGLAAWPVPAAPALPDGTFEATVFGEPPFIEVITTHVPQRIVGYSLTVRSQGWWVQAWPPKSGERSNRYESQISSVRDLIARTVESKDAWRQLTRGPGSCRDWQGR